MTTPKPWVWLLSIAMILAAIGYYLGYLSHGHFGNASAAQSVALCTASVHSIYPGPFHGPLCYRAALWLHQGNLFLLVALGVLGLMGLIYAIAAISAAITAEIAAPIPPEKILHLPLVPEETPPVPPTESKLPE